MPGSSLTVLLAAGLAGGAVAGVGLERAGVLSPLGEPAPVEVRPDRVPVLDCPGGSAVAGLVRGDRVLATGRSDDGAWIEIRSPVALDEPAWMVAGALRGERSLDDLPVHECERSGPTTSSTSTSSTSSSTSTSTSSTSTTEPPPDTTLPPTTTSSTTTTRPSPVVLSLSVQPSAIVERKVDNQQPPCDTLPTQPDRATYTAGLDGPAADVDAVLEISIAGVGQPVRIAMDPDGSALTAVVGPFASGTVAADTVVQARVLVLDGPGGAEIAAFPARNAPANTALTLANCP